MEPFIILTVTLLWFVIYVGGMMPYFDSPLGLTDQEILFSLMVKGALESSSFSRSAEAVYLAYRFNRTGSVRDLRRLMNIPAELQPTAGDCYAVSQLQALFKKRDDLDVGVDKERVALESFFTSEALCKSMNEKLRDTTDPDYQERATLIFKMQRKISRILGLAPVPAELDCGFGPGANVGCKRLTSVEWKIHNDATYTGGALKLLQEVLETSDVYWPGLSRLRRVNCSEFTTVPKSWKTDRGIMIEPVINTFLQKGVGSAIRERLRREGVNLNDQTRNKSLALLGSKTGSLATIDLSMASDTISSLLVLDLLPPDWFDLLYNSRSHFCRVNDEVLELEKFSSMGNGYTFELESMIFYALCRVVCPEGEVSVYGDDLIVPADAYPDVIHALKLLGFVPNDEKSFGDGPFRESCGGDYFGGTDVRPIFIRHEPTYASVVKIHNWVVESGRMSSIRESLVALVHHSLRTFGPAGTGDGHLHTSDLRYSFNKNLQVLVCKYHTFIATPFRVVSSEEQQFCAFMYYNTWKRGLGDLSYNDVRDLNRPRTVKYKKRTVRSFANLATD